VLDTVNDPDMIPKGEVVHLAGSQEGSHAP
jgi:hypothetical protein